MNGISIESNVDGFIQLMSAQRIAESLKADNAKLIKSFNELKALQERKENEIAA